MTSRRSWTSEAGIADVADYEPGAFTEAQVLERVKLRKHSHLACAVYVAASNRPSQHPEYHRAGQRHDARGSER
jgi:hypothetical protein